MERAYFETKILAEESGTISGLAWKFGQGDRIGDWIEPGAFKTASMPIPMLFGHDQNDPVGAWTEAKETSEGYEVKGTLLIDDLPRARQIHALVKSGAVRGLSLGFGIKDAVARKGGGRTIRSLDLVELSLVSIPMHPAARVTSAKSAIEALRLAESINRAAAQIATRTK